MEVNDIQYITHSFPPSIPPSIHPSIHSSIHPSIHSSIHQWICIHVYHHTHTKSQTYTYIYIYMYIRPYMQLYIHPSTHVPIQSMNSVVLRKIILPDKLFIHVTLSRCSPPSNPTISVFIWIVTRGSSRILD